MSLRFKFFAQYREAVGLAQADLEVPSDIASIEQLLAWLGRHHSDWLAVLKDQDKLIGLNQELVSPQARVSAGDEVAFLPPMTGG